MTCRHCGAEGMEGRPSTLGGVMAEATCARCGHVHLVHEEGVALVHEPGCCPALSTPPQRWAKE